MDPVADLPETIEFNIQGKRFSAELWGREDDHPVIALHGWLDNCHSFRPLAPLLKNIRLLALDMAGHGYSEHRSADASYHIWDDVREVLLIAREMGWQRFSLLGHSRGAIVAAMVAAVAPETINRLILLEGMLPQTIPATDAAQQLKKFIDHYLAWDGISKGWKSMDSLVSSRMKAGFCLSESAARLLTLRNTETVGDYYYWRTDPRLLMPSPQMLTDIAASSYIRAIRIPTSVILATDGLGKDPENILRMLESMPNFNVMILPGNHHLHMEAGRDLVAREINYFTGTIDT
jgi:pimeloyl-ACP methyl ester carboxylesterase